VNRELKSARILTAAAQVFARRGLEASTMSQIAAAAAVGKGTLYEYFPSKQALVLAVSEWFTGEMLREVEAMLEEPESGALSAAGKLDAIVHLILDWTDDMQELMPLMMEILAAASTEALREPLGESLRVSYADFRRVVASIVEEGVRRGEFRGDLEPASVATVTVGALDGLFLQAWFDPRIDTRAGGEQLLRLLIGGMKTAGP